MALIERKLSELKKIDFINKAFTATQIYNTYKPSAFINGCLYDMATKTNITKVKDEQKADGYLFSDWGIGIRGDNTLDWVSYQKALTDENIRDFIAGSPTLVEYGVAKLDWGNKVSTAIQGKAYRSAIGFNSEKLYMYTSETAITLEELSRYMQSIGCRWAINLDGGGSSHLQVGDKVYKKSTRQNASWFMIFDSMKGDDKKMKICLDYGHGEETAGKRSPDGTLKEYEFNRSVGKILKSILIANGVDVIETAPTNNDVSLNNRCKIANENRVDYFISIHANAYGNGDTWNNASGWSVHVIGKGGQAEKLAECIRKHAIQELGLKDRGVCVDNFQVLRDTNMPAVLIEHGFYTNKEECEKLKTEEFRWKCAESDAKGILEFLGIPYIKEKEREEASDWAKEAWNWCCEMKYLDGTNPKGTITREMLAQVLYNMFEKSKKGTCENGVCNL